MTFMTLKDLSYQANLLMISTMSKLDAKLQFVSR